MSDLIFIKDVIYGLKLEYGEPIVVNRAQAILNITTGAKNSNVTSFRIQKAIPLPENLRQQFLRQIGQSKEGFLESGEQEFLIEKSDVPSGRVIQVNDYITHQGKRKDVTKVGDYQYGLIVRTKIVK